MLRRTILAAVPCLAMMLLRPHARAQEMAAEAELAQIRKAVIASSGYDDEAVGVKSGPHQIEVMLINSKLLTASRTARINEAHRIAAAVANSIAGKPRFANVDVIHLDYVKQPATSASPDTVDALDFRKDRAGQFKFHVS
jgi:hypothetical protein